MSRVFSEQERGNGSDVQLDVGSLDEFGYLEL